MASRDWLDKDFYAVLGVDQDADAATIKKAYRRIARDNHPDQHPDDEAAERRFKEAGEAFRILSDEDKRREYDEIRRLGAQGAFSGGGRGAGFPGGGGDFSDMFRMIFEQQGAAQGDPFGFGQRTPRRRKGQDLAGDVRLAFDDALAGVTTTLRIGAAAGTPRDVTVRIPAGVRDGARIRVAGKGGPGQNGGPPGDVIVTVRVADHPVFGRDDDDLTLELPISFAEAALGTKLEVPLPLGGTKRIRIPAGTSSGSTFRIRGAGAPRRRGKPGDLLVTVQVDVPETLSAQQRTLVEQLAELDDVTARDRLLGRITT